MLSLKWILAGALLVSCSSTGAQEKGEKDVQAEKPSPVEEAPKPQKLPAPLTADKLPPKTSRPPDPASDQYRRGTVYLRIEEEVKPKERPVYSPATRVLENYVAEYFRRAGFELAARPEDAQHRIEGKFHAEFVEAIVFLDKPIAHKYKGSVHLSVRGKGDEELEKVDVPELFKDGIQKPEVAEDYLAVMDMRRQMAKIVWESLFHFGKTFTDSQIPGLVASLALDDLETEAPVQADAIIKALAQRRLDAVPYLLDFLTDEREVRVNAHYPGLTPQNAAKLRIYHIADKALEEIFQKVSRMDLDTQAKVRFGIIKGWENEWRKFCPSYRNSPQNAARETKAKSSS